MPERGDTNLFEILIGQVTENIEINIILGKALSVLPKTELFEPVPNLLHQRPSTDLTLSVRDRNRIAEQPVNVRFGSLADIAFRPRDVRFTLISGHCDVFALDIADLLQALAKCGQTAPHRIWRPAVEKPNRGHPRLLRPRRKRPCNGRTADKCNEFPSPHGFARAEDHIGYQKNITFLDRELSFANT